MYKGDDKIMTIIKKQAAATQKKKDHLKRLISGNVFTFDIITTLKGRK